MKRRLVKQGAATLMVSIPAKWIKKNSLTKGSEINIEELENDLLLSTENRHIKSETTIRLPNLAESSIRILITNAYNRGYDRITVYFSNENQFKILNNTIKTTLIGFDIIKKEKDHCIIENITEPSDDQFENILRKIFLNINELFDITRKRLNSIDEDFYETEERIQKYYNFCKRVIAKNRPFESKLEMFWTFLVLIVQAQREIYHLNKSINSKTKASEKMIDLLDNAKNMFKSIEKAYFEKNINSIGKLQEMEREMIYKKGYDLLEKNKGKESVIIHHILSSIRLLYLSSSPLTGLII